MSDQMLVATRKGLFTVERTGGGHWTIARRDFMGDNVSVVLADPRDGRRYAALDHGHFGVKLHRSAGPDEPWEEVAAPAYPPKPEGVEELDMWGRPLPWSTVRIWALEAGGADEPGVLWCGTLPGGSVPLRRRRHELGDRALAVGPPLAPEVERRRRRPARHPFDLRRPARFAAACASGCRPAGCG
jgi:hypothetical protein